MKFYPDLFLYMFDVNVVFDAPSQFWNMTFPRWLHQQVLAKDDCQYLLTLHSPSMHP